MKKFGYFFVVYLLLIICTKCFYVFSSEEIQNFISDLSGDTQALESNQTLDPQTNYSSGVNVQSTWNISDLSGLFSPPIQDQSWDIISDSWNNILTGELPSILLNPSISTSQSFSTQQIAPNLSITEVFYDWTDEWIEITNFGADIFSWELFISGVKSSIISIPNFTILPNQSLILWDNCLMISNFSCISFTWLAMSISDTNQINISVFYSWQQLDWFFVDQSSVNTYNNTNTSFEKSWLNSVLIITWTLLDRVYNISSWYLANPGIVQTITITWSNNTWTLSWDYNLPKLSITEVFYDWTDERIEITNFGTWVFVGNLKISGASSSPFDINNISILPDRSMVVSDDNKYFIDFSNFQIHSMSISDSSAISINLFYSWQILDSFYVPQNFVNNINNLKTSFERVLSSWNLIMTITNTGRIYNLKQEYISWWYIANPWKVFQITENITDISSTGNWIMLDLSWLVLPINCLDFTTSPFQITEIFPGNSQTSTFIELLWLSDFSGVVTFSGQWLSGNFDINLNISVWDRILITDGLHGILDEQINIVNTSLELASSWWWVGVFGHSGQVLDIVYFVNFWSPKSSYFDWRYASCARVMGEYDNYSPWFRETLLSYFPQWTPVYVDKLVYMGWWWGWSCPVCLSNTGTDNDVWDFINIYTGSNSGQIKIVSIDYDPEWSDTDRESIALQSLIWQDIDLSDYRLQVVGKDSKKLIRWDILHHYSTETFIGNYQFPNTSACVNLLKDNLILDTYCYLTGGATITNTDTWADWTDVFSWTQNFTWNWNIEILNINYNPEWSDSNNESITLKLNWAPTINLSALKLWTLKDGKTTKKSISWILSQWPSQTFIWNFQFPNTTSDWNNIIVSLVFNDNYILDTYSYNPNIPSDLPAAGIYNVYSVVDGDTFKIKNWSKTISIRLLWSDAPESSKTRFGYIECFWSQAKEYLKNLINKKDIMLQYDNSQLVDSYGRVLWYVYLNWQNINEKIIKDWYAWEYTHQNNAYQYQSLFRQAQDYAQQNSLWLRSSFACRWLRTPIWSWIIIPINTWVANTWTSNIQILSILPNPQWADKWNEKITLIYNIPDLDQQSLATLDLSQWYYLLIWTRKKHLTGFLIPWKANTLEWNFAFPNKAACISIAKDKINLDTFCYDKPDNGEEFKINNWILESVSTIDISILNAAKLQTFGSKICLIYKWQTFHCRNMPSSKTSTKNQNKIRLYENYLNMLDDYLRQNRQVLFYNTDIKNYFNLLNEAKKNISDWIYYVNIDWEYIQTTDIAKRYELYYNQTSYDFILNWLKNNIIWMDIVDKYNKLKEEYFDELTNNL